MAIMICMPETKTQKEITNTRHTSVTIQQTDELPEDDNIHMHQRVHPRSLVIRSTEPFKDLQALQNLQEPHGSDDVVTIDINREGLEAIRFSGSRGMRGFEGDTTDILSNSIRLRIMTTRNGREGMKEGRMRGRSKENVKRRKSRKGIALRINGIV
jgi:hypothetical protein